VPVWFSSLGSQRFKPVLGLASRVDPLRSWLSDSEQRPIGFSRRSCFLALGFESAHRSGLPASFVSWPSFPCAFSDLISAAEQGRPPASFLLGFQLQRIRSGRHQLPPVALWSRSKIQQAPPGFSLCLYSCSLLKVISGLGWSCLCSLPVQVLAFGAVCFLAENPVHGAAGLVFHSCSFGCRA
jgi:hypothetical protein